MRFSAKKSEVIIFTVFFVLFSSLGSWQLKRAEEKRRIETQINARSADKALLLTGTVEWDAETNEYQKIQVKGEFVLDGQLLIDNIIVDSKPGYHVITPMKIAGSDLHILVNRGWVAQGRSREVLPEVELPAGEIVLQGIVRTPSALPFIESSSVPLSKTVPFNLWLYLDIGKYQSQSSLEIVPFAMLQNNDSGDGLLREWPAYNAKVAMHIGYAIQWFAFSLIVTILFIALGRKRGRAENEN